MPSANSIIKTESRSLSQSGSIELSDPQRRGLTALLSCLSVTEAARRCGISRRTLVRWKSEPAFRAAYSAASRERFEDAKDELRAGMVEAAAVLRAALRDPSPRERIRAAVAMLGLIPKIDPSSQDGAGPEPSPGVPKGVVIIGGTPEEYIRGLRELRWSDGDFDPEELPEVEAWRARIGVSNPP